MKSSGVPIIINNRNLSIWPKAMVAELKRMKLCGPIVVVDNDSSNPDTLKWYYEELSKDSNAVVIYARLNGGHKAPFTLGVPISLKEQFGYRYYIVTDPDLDLSACPDTTIEEMLDMYQNMDESIFDFKGNRCNLKDKIGIGIRTDDVPKNALFMHPCELEYAAWKPAKPNWKRPDDTRVVQPALVDTTFALYDFNRIHHYGMGGCRTIHIQMRHLPYYFTPDNFDSDTAEAKEFRTYLATANNSSTAKLIQQGITF